MSRQDFTDITLVLDRSGSMQSVFEATITAFNDFLNSQRKAQGTANLTLVQFDDQYDVLYMARSIDQADELNASNYEPRGSTALLDAMGRSIVETGERLAAMPEHERPGTVLFVTLTDGEENSSKQYNVARINAMIAEQRNKYSWQFLFLAANQDAIATAGQIGISADQALTFSANDQGVAATMRAVGDKIGRLRERRSRGEMNEDLAFSQEDRDAAVGAPILKRKRKK